MNPKTEWNVGVYIKQKEGETWDERYSSFKENGAKIYEDRTYTVKDGKMHLHASEYIEEIVSRYEVDRECTEDEIFNMMWKERTRTIFKSGIKLTDETVRDILLRNEGLIRRAFHFSDQNETEHELVVHEGKLYDNGEECDIERTRLFIRLHLLKSD